MSHAPRLGIAPALVVAAEPIVANWLFGHSQSYKDMRAAVPVYEQAAMAGDVCAYMTLRAWSGEQTYCRYAVANCHAYYFNTETNYMGPCGAADNSSKALARSAFQAVDNARPDMAIAAQAALNGDPLPATVARIVSSSGGGSVTALAGLSPMVIVGVGAVALLAFLGNRKG